VLSFSIIVISVLCIVDQCILWGLTAYKYGEAIRHGLSMNPIVRLVMRDTSWSCLAICCKQWKHFIRFSVSLTFVPFRPIHCHAALYINGKACSSYFVLVRQCRAYFGQTVFTPFCSLICFLVSVLVSVTTSFAMCCFSVLCRLVERYSICVA
jgi:hypothetical protein